MTLITSTEGLSMGQSANNPITGGMRFYGMSKTQSGTSTINLLRFTIASSNPAIHITTRYYNTFQENLRNDTFNTSWTNLGLYVDTSGGIATWQHGGDGNGNVGFDRDVSTSTRQADIRFINGNTNPILSVVFFIYCNRWDYVTVTQL